MQIANVNKKKGKNNFNFRSSIFHKWFLEALHHIQKRIKNINIKSKPWGWRGGSKVKSIDCSCREHRFQYQHPYCSSQPSVPPILGEVILLVISVGMRHT